MSYAKGKCIVDGNFITTEEDTGFSIIAEVDQDKPDGVAEANAARMVKCWNSHDDLVEACKSALRDYKHVDGLSDTPSILRQALTKAGVK